MASAVTLDRTRIETVTRKVRFVGTSEIMFDRYSGDNNTRLEWHQKLYLGADGKTICFPALNIISLLSAHNTNSAPKRLMDKRKYKDAANACLSFIVIEEQMIPFLRDGKPIIFGGAKGGESDPVSGVRLHRSVARLDKGIPNPKERPVLGLPWALEFNLTILPNREIQEQQIVNLLQDAGRALGIGTFRGVFGKFYVDRWD